MKTKMSKDRALQKLVQFISDNQEGLVEVSDGITYSMRDINDENYRLYNRKLNGAEYEASGFRNIFLPKMWVVYRTLVQNSDIDLKHLNTRITNGQRPHIYTLLKMWYQAHLSLNEFGEKLDEILEIMAWFGSAIIKRCDGNVFVVDWRNYITEPNNPDPQTRSHAEILYKTKEQIDSYNWENEDIETLWDFMKEKNEHLFKLLEFWTFDDEGYKICIKAIDRTISKPDDFHSMDEWTPYIITDVFISPYERRRRNHRERKSLGEYERMFPYTQFDLFKSFGRTQGLGCGELLGGLEDIYCELFNNKRKADKKALMGITIHNAITGESGLSQLSQEFISNLMEGAVITLAPGESVNNFPFDTRAQDFQIMEDKIYELMRQIMGVSAQGTGEELPSATSATQAQINENNAQTVYNYVRERMHHGIKKLFHDGYSQDIVKEMDEEGIISVIGDPAQLEAIDEFYTRNAMNKWAFEVKQKTSKFPEQEEFSLIQESLRKNLRKFGSTRFTEFKKDIIDGIDYVIEFEITDETFDAIGRSQALMAIKADPTSSKSKAKIEDQLLLMQNLNPRDFDKTPQEIEAEQAMAEQQQTMPAEAQKAPESFPRPL